MRSFMRALIIFFKLFMFSQNKFILGASWATDKALVRRSFRNWFRESYPYVYAKFRCVREG